MQRMAQLLSIALMLVAVAVAGCSANLTEGVVTAKRHTPRAVVLDFIRTPHTVIPIQRPIPERWSITIEAGGESRELLVDKKTYLSLSLGDYYRESTRN